MQAVGAQRDGVEFFCFYCLVRDGREWQLVNTRKLGHAAVFRASVRWNTAWLLLTGIRAAAPVQTMFC
jgi:hypothetical protein